MDEKPKDEQIDQIETSATTTIATNDLSPKTTPPIGRNRINKRWLIIGAVAFILLCGGVCVATFGIGVARAFMERPQVEKVIDEFMRAMVAKEIPQAYTLFSNRAQRQTERSALEEMITGNNYSLFSGYQGVAIERIDMRAQFNTNQDLPQGTVANVVGTLRYDGDISGQVTAVLEKEDGEWRIHAINITVPPDKLDID